LLTKDASLKDYVGKVIQGGNSGCVPSSSSHMPATYETMH